MNQLTWDEAISKYSLSDNDILDNIKNGLLHENITLFSTPIDEEGDYVKAVLSKAYLNSYGIKADFLQTYQAENKYGDSRRENIFLTDFHMIIVYDRNQYYGFNTNPHKRPNPVKIIPLDMVESIKIDFQQNNSDSWNAEYKEVNKNPGKGALIGAVIAGTTGAVVGAAMNSGTKQETIREAGSYSYDIYSLTIKLLNSETHTISNVFKFDTFDFTKKQEIKDFIFQKEKEASDLINRAKDPYYEDINLKANIVSNALKSGLQDKKNEDFKQIAIKILAILIIIFVILGIFFL